MNLTHSENILLLNSPAPQEKITQGIMIASWLIEVFMSKLNTVDDTISTKAELNMGGEIQAKSG
ncbi:hypothetical protein BGX38DRAFT_1199665 [Terfezia claveryi]|nr:hypothetical protein BGX38DRAFT_1199665 [Terfezia claveryi]